MVNMNNFLTSVFGLSIASLLVVLAAIKMVLVFIATAPAVIVSKLIDVATDSETTELLVTKEQSESIGIIFATLFAAKLFFVPITFFTIFVVVSLCINFCMIANRIEAAMKASEAKSDKTAPAAEAVAA